MKQWLMLQKFVALNTMYRKIHQKLVKFKTPDSVEKQLDFIHLGKQEKLETQQRRRSKRHDSHQKVIIEVSWSNA